MNFEDFFKDSDIALISAFNEAGVKFMLVGGEAVRFHGARTDDDAKNDTDILYRHDCENCTLISKAVSKVYPQFANGNLLLNVGDLTIPKRRYKVAYFSVDLLGCSELSDFDNLDKAAVSVRVSNQTFKVISLIDLIVMKEAVVCEVGPESDKHNRDLVALKLL